MPRAKTLPPEMMDPRRVRTPARVERFRETSTPSTHGRREARRGLSRADGSTTALEHRRHVRSTDPIESSFATLKLRTRVMMGAGSSKAALAMAYKRLDAASQRWRRCNGHELLADVLAGGEVQARHPRHRRREPPRRDTHEEVAALSMPCRPQHLWRLLRRTAQPTRCCRRDTASSPRCNHAHARSAPRRPTTQPGEPPSGPPNRRPSWARQSPAQHPAVVLRSHYIQLRALLASAMIAVLGLTAAVVILATDDDPVTIAGAATPVIPPSPAGTTRYDGGPEEGTRSIVPVLQPGVRYDGGPEEGTVASPVPVRREPRSARALRRRPRRRHPRSPARGANRNSIKPATRYDGGPDEGTRSPLTSAGSSRPVPATTAAPRKAAGASATSPHPDDSDERAPRPSEPVRGATAQEKKSPLPEQGRPPRRSPTLPRDRGTDPRSRAQASLGRRPDDPQHRRSARRTPDQRPRGSWIRGYARVSIHATGLSRWTRNSRPPARD